MNHQAAHNQSANITALRRGVQRYGFNGKEVDSEGMGGGSGSYDFGLRIYRSDLARFLSLDPLAIKMPYQSPYCFAGNSPIGQIDVEGGENIVYIVVLPSARVALNPVQLDLIESIMNRALEMMSLKTRAVLFDRSEVFNPEFLDPHDTFVLLGNSREIHSYMWNSRIHEKYNSKPGRTNYIDLSLDDLMNNTEKFEDGSMFKDQDPSRQGGMGAAVALEKVDRFAQRINESLEIAIAITMLHAVFSHNTNVGPDTPAPLAQGGCRIMQNLNPIPNFCFDDTGVAVMPGRPLSLTNLIMDSMMNPKFLRNAQSRFGINKAKDNYDDNKKRNSENKKRREVVKGKF